MEIEGSEDFVSKQIENLKDIITKLPSATPPPAPVFQAQTQLTNGQTTSTVVAALSQDAAKYVNVISVDNGVVKVLKGIPGADNAKKMINAALLYLFGKNLAGQEEASFKELRQVCKDHGCLDETNFAKKLKVEREWIIVTGGGKSQVAKLTVPGKRQAQTLADQLNAT